MAHAMGSPPLQRHAYPVLHMAHAMGRPPLRRHAYPVLHMAHAMGVRRRARTSEDASRTFALLRKHTASDTAPCGRSMNASSPGSGPGRPDNSSLALGHRNRLGMAERWRHSPTTILTVDDLAGWSFEGTALAVLGHPVAHSLSPVIHRAALAEIARTRSEFRSWDYFRVDVPTERLGEALDALHAHGFLGLNLTVPHKILACGLIHDIAPAAFRFGAVNTLERTAHGWRGHNTDGHGLAAAVAEELGIPLPGATVILLGAGGRRPGCRRRVPAARMRRAVDCEPDARAPRRPAGAAAAARGRDPAGGFRPIVSPRRTSRGRAGHQCHIGGTPAENDRSPMELARLPRPAGVFDMVYRPAVTELLREAAALGVRHANGLTMLVHQGAKSLELWTGVPAESTVPVDVAGDPRGGRRRLRPAGLTSPPAGAPQSTHPMTDYAAFAAAFPWFFPLCAFVFGACIGSFLNVCIYRMPAGQSIVTPGSHCACGAPIRWYDNIPIASWLVLRGRARCCGRPFSIRYPLVELLTAASVPRLLAPVSPGQGAVRHAALRRP